MLTEITEAAYIHLLVATQTKNTNGHGKTKLGTRTLHLRPPGKTVNLIRKQARKEERTIHAHACLLLRKAAEMYERDDEI